MPSRVIRQLLRWWHTPVIRRWTLTAAFSALGFGTALGWGSWARACLNNACPSVAGLGGYSADQASKVYAADGRLVTDFGLQRRTVISLSQMSPAVIAAFLATEDKRFYQHHGIDWIRVFGAIKDILIERRIAGGASTITMQLAGNLWPEEINRSDRSFRRKLREAQVAMELERTYPKDKILELYLNQIDLGNRAFGVEAAAQRYFGKSARDLNVAEAATLAALPKSPAYYNPRRHRLHAIERRNTIINLLRDNGYLTAAEAERWKAYPLVLSNRSDFSEVAPYFTEYVRQLMEARFGPDLYTSGYRIHTTLDLDIQLAAERSLEAQLEAIENGQYGPYHHETYAQYIQDKADKGDASQEGPSYSPYLQGISVVLEARTGNILAMVGGRDFDDSKYNRAVNARRQPGSTFKPFVYSAALRAGHPLSEILVDEPLSVPMGPTEPPWEPQNYDQTFRGPMTLRQALTMSDNIVTIRLGMEELGEQAVIAEATKFGITTKIPSVPSIHIGSADVQPLEMISAYTAFANMGERSVPNPILWVEDKDGNIVWRPQAQLKPVMDSDQAWLMIDVMRDVLRSPLGSAHQAWLDGNLDLPAAGKTGTTDDGTDVWFIGYTPDLVAGVWMGLDKPDRIKNGAAGGILAAPAWMAMMKDIYQRRAVPRDPWPRPPDLTFAEIDRQSGERALPFCPTENRFVESYLPGTEPKTYCHLHAFNPIGGGTPQYPGQN
ncbi:MAG TPA: PBP1A family penicillin-binding protein [Gemmatimonadales bacterium]|nr:PBP1A family penicillin-binding protein [Gemmatimonadales bacterium]